MGVHISSKNKGISMGYGGFQRLRRTVAECCPKDISEHYCELLDNLTWFLWHKDEMAVYDGVTEKLYERYRRTPYRKVIAFLYAPDCDHEFPYGVAKALLKVIGDYDDELIYGYAGWGKDAARFKDFKELLQDAVDTKSSWKWD